MSNMQTSLFITPYFYFCSLTYCCLIKQPVWEIHFLRMADFSAQVPCAFISINLFIRFLFQIFIQLCLLLLAFSAEEVVGHLNISNFLTILKCYPLPLLTWKYWLVCVSDSEDQRWELGLILEKINYNINYKYTIYNIIE